MKDKTNLKIMVAMIITAIVSIGGTVLAESALNANQINYNNTTVADALDGMYRINSFQTNYSTDEKVVGTWIDGKPVYQKTVSISENISSYSGIRYIQKVVQNNVDHIIDSGGYFYLDGNPIEFGASEIDWNRTPSFHSHARVMSNNLEVYILYNSNNYSDNPITGTIWVQYTKTTD